MKDVQTASSSGAERTEAIEAKCGASFGSNLPFCVRTCQSPSHQLAAQRGHNQGGFPQLVKQTYTQYEPRASQDVSL